MRLAFTILAYLATFVVVAAAAFFGVLVLAGPHGGALPSFMQTPALLLGWVLVLVVPVLAARWAWRRLAPPLADSGGVDTVLPP